VAAQLRCQFSDKILSWNKSIPQQHTLLNKQDRIKNMNEAFKIDSTKIEQSHLLVVDDILTTGATMNEALKTLSQHYPDKTINGIALSFVHLGEEK
jgi:predicted amidophosphoribosyltransferase